MILQPKIKEIKKSIKQYLKIRFKATTLTKPLPHDERNADTTINVTSGEKKMCSGTLRENSVRNMRHFKLLTSQHSVDTTRVYAYNLTNMLQPLQILFGKPPLPKD